MTVHVAPRPIAALVLLASLGVPMAGSGQWLKQPTPGIARTAEGKPDLSAPAPRTPDGKPDLSGLWQAGDAFSSDFKAADAREWALAEFRARERNIAADSWSVLCLPAGPMVNFTGPFKIMQTPNVTAFLYETTNNFRQIFTDGRALPQDPNPTWQGYSVGRWEGDTLVVETVGFNDKSRVGRPTYPHTEELRLTERYHRRDFGHIDLQMTVEDRKTFVRPWTITTELVYEPDTELLEFVCNENEKDRQHFVHTDTSTAGHRAPDATVLNAYVGTYQVPGPRGRVMTVKVSIDGDQLAADVTGMGYAILTPQSDRSFLYRGAVIEFIVDDQGRATHLVAHAVEGDFKGPRVNAP